MTKHDKPGLPTPPGIPAPPSIVPAPPTASVPPAPPTATPTPPAPPTASVPPAPPAPTPTPPAQEGKKTASAASVSATSVSTKPELNRTQKIGAFAGLVLLLAVLLGLAVLAARWFLSTSAGAEFIERYPGHSPLPHNAPVGIPPWMNWQHFLNSLFMLLIISSGIKIHSERRAEAYWTPHWNPGRKISITLWFHMTVDILWVLNGVIFVFALFVSGHWMRIVPTSWEVIPHAVSAGLQYLSLDWPTENGWVHYNALQMLTYFFTVFVAAPLAILSGWRMSGLWSKSWTWASKHYPLKVARAIHWPIMLYFVLFVVVHVGLVFATGALRNLNHMYAAQGSADPTAYANNWTGFLVFLGSLVIMAAALAAARPAVLVPIARIFGKVTSR